MGSLKAWQADLMLLGVAFTWGTTFIVVKKALLGITPFAFMAVRFSIAFLFLLVLYKPSFTNPFKNKNKAQGLLSNATMRAGFSIGVFLFLGYGFQTLGLQYTSASNAGFITGLSVVLVPLLNIYFSRLWPKLSVILGALAATCGLALLTMDNGYALQKGDILVLLCAFSFALHIIFVGKYAPNHKSLELAILQIGVVAVLSAIISLFHPQEFFPSIWSKDIMIGLALTAIPATSLALLIQSSVQRYTSPARTAIIFAMEPVFAAAAAWYYGGEILQTQALWGAALVLVGIIITELHG